MAQDLFLILDEITHLVDSASDISKYYNESYKPSKPSTCEHKRSLMVFMNSAARYRRLTREEEKELSKCKMSGDSLARDILILTNLKLVVKISHDFRDRGVPLEDLVAEGLTGLIRGVDRYDPTNQKHNNAKLSTYVAWWIKQAIHKSVSNHSSLIRIPIQSANTASKIKKISAELAKSKDGYVSDKEIAMVIGKSERTVNNLRDTPADPISMEDFINETEIQYSCVLSTEALEEDILKAEELNVIYDAISKLSPREQVIIKERFGLLTGERKSLTALEPIIGRTRERIRQIESKALDKLKVILSEYYTKD